ncbi:acyltransferase family protein [Hyphomicrobium sp.]|uniref:acyltransferase family protein n=1 Tax=Hyphomicrobium sp. TaxID=82 RepID=UPI003F724FCE
MARSEAGLEPRLAWVDVAKGLCILLVVLMHATLGVEKAVGSETGLHAFIEWARPFRMPDFFLISGLFLAARIDRPWRSYLDTKVVHFAYFYVLWLTIQFAMKAPGMVQENGAAATLADYLTSFVVPFGTLWFIYLLAVYFVVAKLLRPLPKWLVIAGAAALHVFTPHTGIFIVDEFASRFVFFYAGYALAPQVFAFADRVRAVHALAIAAGLAAWAVFNAIAVNSGVAHIAGPDLAFSFIGIAAVIAFSVAITHRYAGQVLAYCGRNSIAVYLAFPLFMGPVRIVLLKLAGTDAATAIAVASALAGVVGALAMQWAFKGTRASFLFTRPAMFRLQPRRDAGPAAGASPATA